MITQDTTLMPPGSQNPKTLLSDMVTAPDRNRKKINWPLNLKGPAQPNQNVRRSYQKIPQIHSSPKDKPLGRHHPNSQEITWYICLIRLISS